MIARRVVVVGDTLLDRDVVGQVDRLCPDAPVPVFDQQDEYLRPGGAGLAAVLAASGGRPVTLVTALADDDAGRRLRRLLADAGVDVVDLGLRGPNATITSGRVHFTANACHLGLRCVVVFEVGVVGIVIHVAPPPSLAHPLG